MAYDSRKYSSVDHSIAPTYISAYNNHSVDVSGHSSQSNIGTTSIISFTILKVCKTFRDRNNCTYVNIPQNETIERAKAKITQHLSLNLSSNAFNLMIFDEKDYDWKKIDDSNPDATLSDLHLKDYGILNLEKHSSIGINHQKTIIDRTSTSKKKDRILTLKLCTSPMETEDYKLIETNSLVTVSQLRKQACKRLNYSSSSQPLYRLTKGGWMKFESVMDDNTLADLEFDTYAFISFDSDEKNEDSKYPPGVCGLYNLASTCFINSAIQCLANVPELKKQILTLDNEMNAFLIGPFKSLIEKMWSGKYDVIRPSALLDSIRENMPDYAHYRQQDAQEFMNCFLHLIHAELTKDETFITKLFYGRLKSIVTCTGCGNIEPTDEPISFLPLPVGKNDEKSILYLKASGERCLVSVRINSGTRYMPDLIGCFIKQHEPTFTRRDRILAVRMCGNEAQEKYTDWQSLSDLREDELAFIELPEKTVVQKYIRCCFLDNHTKKAFRPPIYLVWPKYDGRYRDLHEQLDQILAHLYSSTNAPNSACQTYWINDRGIEHPLNSETNEHDELLFTSKIVIKMDNEWTRVYEQRYNVNRLVDKSSLFSLLNDFFSEGLLDGEYHCLKCTNPTLAKQRAVLVAPLPRVLVIQLKRFTYDLHSNDKIDTHINFPLHDLNLSNFVEKNNDEDDNTRNMSSAKYDLVAVCNHTGSLIGGHYITYAKNDQNQCWYSFNDDYVRDIDEKDVVTKNAYILVYVIKGANEDGANSSK